MIQQKYSDEELVTKVLEDDTALFELIIRRNNPYLYRIGKMYRFSHEDIEDLMQETYIEVYKNLKKFANRSSFRTWISKIMFHKCYHSSHNWTVKNVESLEDHPIYFQNLPSKETLDNVMNNEMNSVIENALLKVPMDHRSVFIFREINGLSVAETAHILEISEGNVKVRLTRAKTFLRTEIEKFYNKEEIFNFNLIYCDAIVNRVMEDIKTLKIE